MYYPKQVPYILDKEFKDNIEYIEYKVKEIADYCMCIWQMKSKRILNKSINNNILPDACIDIVIDFTNKTIAFAGFSKETESFKLNKTIDYMGIRLKPGSFYSLFNIQADKIMDNIIEFSEIEKEFSIKNILSIKEASKRIDILKTYLLKRIEGAQNNKIIEIIDKLYEKPKEKNVLDIAKEFGYDKRHLTRVFKTYYGISPKVLLNILRLHLCLTLLLEEKKNLLDIAMICGFYDQSHFIRELKRYTGISPIQLLKNYNE